MIIGGQEVRNGQTVPMVCPHDHRHVLGHYHAGAEEHVHQAIAAANAAKQEWSTMPWDSRAIVLLKAAELLAGMPVLRGNRVDLLIEDSRPYRLSRAHFSLTARNGSCVLQDLESTLGTQVNGRYVGRLDPATVVQRLATAEGRLGSCRDYLKNTVSCLSEFGFRDRRMTDLLLQVQRYPTP